jgi:hypothetical protein
MSEYLFGIGSGWLPKRADIIARKFGASLYNHSDAECKCGHSCRPHTCKATRRHWFAGPSQGDPYDHQLSQKVMAAIAEAGL